MRPVIFTAALLLAGCSGTKLGAMCYLPAGMVGACIIVPAEVMKSGG